MHTDNTSTVLIHPNLNPNVPPVPLPLRSRLCQSNDKHPRCHFLLHLLPRGPPCLFCCCPHGQGKCCILTLCPVNQRIIDKGLKKIEEGLSSTTKDFQDVFTGDSEEALGKREEHKGCVWYSGTSLNGHPLTADTYNLTNYSKIHDCPSILLIPLNSEHPLLHILDSHSYTKLISLNDPDLVDTRWSFQQECLQLLL